MSVNVIEDELNILCEVKTMTNIERANRWAEIINRFYEIESNMDYSYPKRWLCRHYIGFAGDMCKMYCDKAAYGKE